MSFKTRLVQQSEGVYSVQYSPDSNWLGREWLNLAVWDKKQEAWFVREFSQKRAEQVARQLTSMQEVLTAQAESYK
jgi:hypothetical protein